MSFDIEEYIKERRKKQSTNNTTSSGSDDFDVESYIRQRNAPEVADAVSKRFQSLVTGYNDLFNSYTSRYQNVDNSVYRSDANDWLAKINEQTGSYYNEGQDILKILDEYGSYFDKEWVSSVYDAIGQYEKFGKDISSEALAEQDFWSQWSGAEEYEMVYDNATYGTKYADMSYADILKAIESTDGRENAWLTSNADSYMTSWEAQAEIDRLRAEAEAKSKDKSMWDHVTDFVGSFFTDASTGERNETEQYHDRIAQLEGIRDTARRTEKVESYNLHRGDNSFGKKAAEGAALSNPTWGELNEYQTLLEAEAMGDPEKYQALVDNPVSVRNKLNFYFENKGMSGYLPANPAAAAEWENIPHEGLQKNWDYLKEDEIEMYNYLLAQNGTEAADQYLEDIQVVLDQRATETANTEIQNLINNTSGFKGVLLNTGLSIASIPANIIGGITSFLDNTVNQLQGDSINPYSPAQSFRNFATTVRGEVGAEIADTATWEMFGQNVMQNVYNSAMSMGDSLVGATTMGSWYSLVAASGAAASHAADLYEKGASNSQIFWGGLAAGAAEAVFEKFSIDNLLKAKNPANFGQYVLEVLKQAGVEGSEEVATELANLITDGIVMGSQSDLSLAIKQYENGYYDENGIYHESMSHEDALKKAMIDKVSEVVWAGISGMLSGGGSSSIMTGIQTIQNSNAIRDKGSEILSTNGGYNALKNLANETSSEGLVKGEGNIKSLVEKTQKGVDAINKGEASNRLKNKTAKQVGKLSQAVDSVRNEQNLAEIRSSLESKGLSKSQAKVAAKLLNEALYTEGTYSEELYNSIMNDKGVWDTLRELVSSTDSTLKSRNEKHMLGRMGLKKGENGSYTSTTATDVSQVDEKLSFIEDASKRVYEVSTDGKSIDKSTGKAIDVVDVASIKDGKMMLKVKDADGAESVVNAKDVSYASESEALVYEAVANMGLNAVSANSILKLYNPTQDAAVFARGVQEAYRYGLYNYSENEMYQEGNFLLDLTDGQIERAYKLGQIQSGSDTAVAVSKLKEAIANSKGKKGEGKVHFEGDAVNIDKETLKDQQKVSLKTMEMLSKALGIEFYVYSSYENKDGDRVYRDANGEVKPAPNGRYDRATGAIHIDLNAGEGGEGTMLFTVAHELTHFIKAWSPAKYKVLANFLVEQYGKKGVSVEQLVRRQMANMKANGRKNVTYDKAFDEVVADSMQTMLTSGNVVESLAEIKRRDEGLWNKIKEFFSNLVEHLKEVVSTYSEFAPDTVEGQTVAQMTDVIEQFEKLFTEGLVDASENFRAISSTEQQTLAEAGIGFDEDTRSVHSLRFSTGRKDALGNVIDLVKVGKKEFNTEAIAQLVAKGTGRSIEDARKWVNSEIAIANIVMNHPEFLDFQADDRYESIKKNSDYPQGTVDLSNLCPKRTEFTAMFDMLQKKYPNKLFTASDVAAMRSILKKRGITVACGACFVEDRRQLLGEIADTYIGMWKEAVETGKPLQKTNASGNKVTLTVTAALAKQYGLKKGSEILATDKYIPTQYDLTTYEGFKLLEKNHPTIAMGFNRYNNSRGQQAGRLIEGRAEYNRQILGWSPTKVKTVNNNGGLRIFSFSDFEVVHLLDLVQVILDCSAMGVKIQGYTKIPAFARLVRDTGIKINRSLIPKGQTGLKTVNGKQVLDYDTTEGIDINDENFIDERDNPNVGNILIGINPTQIGIAMLDDFVDYIIPFHTNKSKDICKALGLAEWVNYKKSQHEKDIATGEASKHNVNIYTEVIGKYHPTNKVEFVDAFLKVCKAQKKTPRYSEFLSKEYKADGAYTDEYGSYDFTYREGYHKLLVDFKMFDHNGNILPQGEITPNLDDGFMAELLKGEVDKKQSYEFPQEVYEQLDKEFGKNELRSDRMLSQTYIDNLLNGFGITKLNDFVHAQRQVLSTLEKEGFFTDAEHRSRTDVNKKSGMVIETNKSGIEETFNKNNFERRGKSLKLSKLATIRMLPEIIRNGQLVDDDISNYHAGKTVRYAYIEHNVVVDGVPMTVKVDIRKSKDKNKMWVHSVYAQKNISGSDVTSEDGVVTPYLTADIGDRIAQKSKSVKDFDENPHSDRKKDSDDTYSRIYDMQVEVNRLTESIKEFEKTPEFKTAMDALGEAINNGDIDKGVKAYHKWQVDSGYDDMVSRRDALRVELENLRKEFDEGIANKAIEEEKAAIAKSGLSEAEYFRKSAIKEFGYTPYFYDAGYLLPNGKMLNFSGEKGKHFGTRGQDHRAIGTVYANESGGKAMLKFMSEGNIRIMAETPGLDISSIAEPTTEQYSAIKRFVREYAKKQYFAVDITDEKGNVIGTYSYENNINADRVVNDIKYYFANGKMRETSVVADFHYSDRNKNSVSSRSLLANALDATVQTEFEKKTLADYKQELARADALEKELAEIRSKLKELYFAKGHKDAEAIKKLKAQETKTVNRIDVIDKKLLRLEATKPLKDIIHREREKAYKRAEKEGKEALAKYREKATETQRELINRWQESRKNAVEGRSKTAMRHKIKGVVSDLNKLLLDGSKDKHVPIGLQKPVAEALDIINMDTVGADNRVAKYNDLIAKAKDPDIIAELTKSRDRIALQGDNIADKLNNLKSAYAEIKNSDDPLVRDAHNEAIEDLIASTATLVGNTALRDMSQVQLDAVYDMYKAILATVRNANKMFKADRQETITDNSEAVKSEVKAAGGHRDRVLKATKALKKFGWNMLKPIYAMKLIGSNTLTRLYENVRKGEDTWAVDVSEARSFFQETKKKHNYDSWDFKKRYTFQDSTGNSFSLTLEQIMSLYAYSKREQADLHLEFGGFIFDDAIEVTEKNKLGIPMKYEVNDANPYRLNKADLATIINTLNTDLKEVKGFVDDMQAYLSDVMGAKGNEVSLAMYDIKLYKEKNYFPLKTAKYFREFDPEKNGTPKIKNSGFSKKTVPQAGNPIILSNFMDVWANHVNDMSMYHAFVLPLEDFMRVYNYSSTAGGYDSVQQYIKNAYGSQANSYIETLMNDLNGGARTDPATDLISKGMSLFKKAAVFASASVVIQQPSAMARAFAYIDPKYFVDKPLATKHDETWAEVKKYAPVAIIKEMGYFDTNMGRSTVDWIRDEKTLRDKIDDAASKAPALADELTWCAIWKAVKREVAATSDFKVGSEEFLKKAGERFTEVVTKTQVYDSVLSRSSLMRSKDTGAKMITAFMAEPTTSVNMVVDAIIEGKRGNKKFKQKTFGAVASSIILNSILVSIVTAARDDDEDETYTEKYLESLTAELLDGFNPLTYIPLIKDIWSIAQGYDVERSDMSIWSDLWASVENLFSNNKSGFEKVEGIAGSIASVFGLPLKNIMRDARALYNFTTTVLSGTPNTMQGTKDAILGSVKSSIPLYSRIEQYFGLGESKTDKLYNALASGSQAQIDRIKAGYKDEEAYENAVKQAIRENDKDVKNQVKAFVNGDFQGFDSTVKAVASKYGISEELASEIVHSEYDYYVGKIEAAAEALNEGKTEDYKNIVRTLRERYRGVYSQDDIVNAIKEKSEEPAGESSNDVGKQESIYETWQANTALENGDIDTAITIIDDLVRVKTENNLAKARAEAESNGKSFNERKALQEAESKAKSSVKSSITSYWKPLVKAAKGNTTELYRIRELLFKTGLYGKTYSEVYSTMKEWMNG